MLPGEDYLPFAEIPSLRNMVLTGEDDGDMSYMRLQERHLKPGASNSRALPASNHPLPSTSHRHDSSVVPYQDDDHVFPRGQNSRAQQNTTSHRGQRHMYYNNQSHKTGSEQSGRADFRPTYD